LLERPDKLMRFRFILQHVTAAIAARQDGIEDAKLGHSLYLWALLTNPTEPGGRLEEGYMAMT
jgi:hypothetical protein